MRRGKRFPRDHFRRDCRPKQESIRARPWWGSGLSSGSVLLFAGMVPFPQLAPDPSSGPHTAPPADLV